MRRSSGSGGRPSIPQRTAWAVETLAVQPGERILEIGCGSGLAAALVCEQLAGGGMVAIDRSETQIERARRRNAEHVASGRLALEAVELAHLELRGARFDKVFAVNVNAFWLGSASAELAVAREALAPGGTLYLFYEAPSPARACSVAERLPHTLRAGGFAEPTVLRPSETLVGCCAQLRGA